MPRDINGNTSPLTGTIVNTGDTITPSQHNPALFDLYAMMTQSLSRDGQGGMRTNLDMSGFRIRNLGSPTLPTDAALFGQTEPSRTFAIRGANYTIVSSDKNSVQRFTTTVTCSLDPAATLGDGLYFTVQASGGDVTIDPNGAETINGAATIVIPDGYSTLVWCNGTAFFALQDYASVQSLATPPGAVTGFAMSSPPTGWLKANGTGVSRTTYANLFAAIGTTYGAGNGTTTFNLPDLRGEFVRGWDDGRGVDSGRVFGSNQLDAFQNHTFNVPLAADSLGGSGVQNYRPGGDPNPLGNPIASSAGTPRVANETRPRSVALLYCIKI